MIRRKVGIDMFQFSINRDECPQDREMKINIRRAVRAVIFYRGKLLMVKTSAGDYKFPGGGVYDREDKKFALVREIQEETGYTNVTVGPCVGKATEQNIDIFDQNAIFRMESSYYLCLLNSLEQVEQSLEQYEKDMEFQPVFVAVEEAYAANKKLLDEAGNQVLNLADIKIKDWVDRETEALKFIKESYVDKLLSGILECGLLMKNADRSVLMVDDKAGHANFVTNYDKKIQEELAKRLLSIYPGARFIGEEEATCESSQTGFQTENDDMPSKRDIQDYSEYAFIVDPIDGTTNFMKDYKQSCISVGLTKNGEQVAGIVYQPYAEEMFCAEKGKGAYLNGEKIHVSNNDMEHALVAFGTAPYYEELRKESFAKAELFCGRCIDVRRSGSAAIDLCNVAAGRTDLYFEYRICPWDIAAGSLIVTEAGGMISQIDGSDITLEDKCSILATNGVTYML